jgi:hypothetical protein
MGSRPRPRSCQFIWDHIKAPVTFKKSQISWHGLRAHTRFLVGEIKFAWAWTHCSTSFVTLPCRSVIKHYSVVYSRHFLVQSPLSRQRFFQIFNKHTALFHACCQEGCSFLGGKQMWAAWAWTLRLSAWLGKNHAGFIQSWLGEDLSNSMQSSCGFTVTVTVTVIFFKCPKNKRPRGLRTLLGEYLYSIESSHLQRVRLIFFILRVSFLSTCVCVYVMYVWNVACVYLPRVCVVCT